MDNHDAAAPPADLTDQLWVVATAGRLAGKGLLERPAESTDAIAVAGQRLLIAAGLLDTDPVRPAERLHSLLTAGAPLTAMSWFVRELLAMVSRYAEGAPAGWAETDPGLISSRGATSGEVFLSILEQCRAYLPGLPERLDRPAAAFLDVGTGAAGIVIAMCRAHDRLHAVGLDVSPAAVAVAREQVAAAGLGSPRAVSGSDRGRRRFRPAMGAAALPARAGPGPGAAAAASRGAARGGTADADLDQQRHWCPGRRY